MQTENPLVTVGIVTYNSAKYVLETLESAKAQTYPNIELIVSDDCSTDNTVEICREWIEKNGSRFVRCELITSPKNTGISANCNRQIRAAQGEWLKSIAGDDIFLPDCIEKFMNFVRTGKASNICFSRLREFCDRGNERVLLDEIPNKKNKAYFEKPAFEQFKGLASGNFWVPAPACFIRTEFAKRNLYNELYTALEDLPQWCKSTKSGEKLTFCDEQTVLYRVNSGGISCTRERAFYSERFMESRRLFFLREWRGYLKELGFEANIKKIEREFLLFDFTRLVLKNRKNKLTSFLRHLFSRILKMTVR